jgi:predicted  nucleic acid-binding Zn-ribbon protein
MSTVDSTEARLSTHEAVCAERYAGLDRRMTNIDEKFNKLESEVKDLKDTTSKNFSEIKSMLQTAKDEKFKVMVTVAGTVIVSLLGVMGYLITHIK